MYINYCPSHLSSKWFPYFGKRVELVRPCLVRSQIFPSPRGTSGNCLLLPPPTSGLFSENQMKTFYFPTTQLPINLHSVQWFSMFNHNNKSSYTYTYIQIYTYRDEEIEKNTITLFQMGYGTGAIPFNFFSINTLRWYIPPIPSYLTFLVRSFSTAKTKKMFQNFRCTGVVVNLWRSELKQPI